MVPISQIKSLYNRNDALGICAEESKISTLLFAGRAAMGTIIVTSRSAFFFFQAKINLLPIHSYASFNGILGCAKTVFCMVWDTGILHLISQNGFFFSKSRKGEEGEGGKGE